MSIHDLVFLLVIITSNPSWGFLPIRPFLFFLYPTINMSKSKFIWGPWTSKPTFEICNYSWCSNLSTTWWCKFSFGGVTSKSLGGPWAAHHNRGLKAIVVLRTRELWILCGCECVRPYLIPVGAIILKIKMELEMSGFDIPRL